MHLITDTSGLVCLPGAKITVFTRGFVKNVLRHQLNNFYRSGYVGIKIVKKKLLIFIYI